MNVNTYVSQLPDRLTLKKICKAQAVLDWIICGQEFETYHKYFKSTNEEYEGNEAQIGFGFEEDEGTSLHLYFTEKGCLIVPSQCENTQNTDNKQFEKKIPKEFQAFYKKNFAGQDIPFVIYSLGNDAWKCEHNFEIADDEIFSFQHIIYDAEFYKEWAIGFFADETYLKEDADIQTIEELYAGKVLTEKMVLSIVDKIEDWLDLEDALNEMPYRFDF